MCRSLSTTHTTHTHHPLPLVLEQIADLRRNDFLHPEGDAIGLLTLYTRWVRAGASMQWCRDNYVHMRALRRAADVRNQLASIMEKNRMPVSCKPRVLGVYGGDMMVASEGWGCGSNLEDMR